MPRNRTFIRSIRPTSSRMIMILSKTIVGSAGVWRGHLRGGCPSFQSGAISRPRSKISLHPMGPGCGDLVAGRQRLSEFQSNGRWPGKNRFSEVTKRLGCNLPLEPLRLPSSWCSRRPRSLGLIDPIRKTIMPMKCFLMRARSSGLCFPLWMVPSFFVETVIGSMPRKIRRQGCGNLAADQEVPDTSWDGRKAIKGPSTDFCAWQVGILVATPGGMSWVSHDWC